MNTPTLPLSPAAALSAHPAGRARRAPFLPHGRISLRTTAWSILLGIALVCPAIMALALLPFTPTAGDRAMVIGLFPALAMLKHVLLGPLLEELLFRGLILQIGRRYLPAWSAVTISSLLFAVPHLAMNVGTTLLAFPMGCVFCWLVIRSGSLVPAFLCHAMFNFAALFVFSPLFGIIDLALTAAPGTRLPGPFTLFPAWMIVSTLGLAAAAGVMLARDFARRAPAE